MILYLYAVADGLDDVAGLTGVADEPLAVLPLQTHFVIAGWMPAAPALERARLAAQGALVQQLHDLAAALLPMRFGTAFPSITDAERAITTMSAGLHERLARARGREQMTVRVLTVASAGRADDSAGTGAGAKRAGPEATAAEGALGEEAANGLAGIGRGGAGEKTGAGARYLAARAARAIPPELTPLLQALRPLQRATRIEPGRRSGVVATIYQLIDRGSAEAYRASVNRAAPDLPALTLRVTGPSPCYAFS